ncbi:hypothetical protein [Powai lake megavirus]|uniref:Uncharacterized protein n=1 Tax=Powai lake megavirus TaxID=1842663 RepID=A0A167R4P1_9VIRU|nr:hypothetical protein QJ849_gp145 [Powai lake megavirus]ANB50307.1 hypothetical protein [Powai lake megavirus]
MFDRLNNMFGEMSKYFLAKEDNTINNFNKTYHISSLPEHNFEAESSNIKKLNNFHTNKLRTSQKLDLTKYNNKIIQPDGTIKIIILQPSKQYCVKMCGKEHCSHALASPRNPYNRYCYVDSEGWILEPGIQEEACMYMC